MEKDTQEIPEYIPGVQVGETFRSTTLARTFSNLDRKVYELEKDAEYWAAQAKSWEDKYYQEIDEKFKASNKMIGEVLKAAISVPTISSIGPVGATIIAKIRDMKTIKEVHKYIESIAEQNKEELESFTK